jgi:Tfp pilus assembly protein FimT
MREKEGFKIRGRRGHARGFTLFEVLIVVAFIVILFQLISLFGIRAIFLQEIDQVRETVRSELASARDHAISGSGSASAWGVSFATSSMMTFKGASFESRDPSYDFETVFGSRVVLTGTEEIVFTPPFGEPQTSGTVMITNGTEYATATVNPYGAIEVQ